MTKLHIIETESAILLFVAAIAGSVFAFSINHKITSKNVFQLPVIAVLSTPTPTQEPTPTTFSQVSPDGTKKVIMDVTKYKSSATYVFSITDGSGNNSKNLYSISLPDGEYMDIPFNTFSPNDAYLFLEHVGKDGTQAYAFAANGTSLGENSQYDNVTQIFNDKQTGNSYITTTGWASDTLLIVNSKTPTGTTQSYWVELPSKAVIPLATTF